MDGQSDSSLPNLQFFFDALETVCVSNDMDRQIEKIPLCHWVRGGVCRIASLRMDTEGSKPVSGCSLEVSPLTSADMTKTALKEFVPLFDMTSTHRFHCALPPFLKSGMGKEAARLLLWALQQLTVYATIVCTLNEFNPYKAGLGEAAKLAKLRSLAKYAGIAKIDDLEKMLTAFPLYTKRELINWLISFLEKGAEEIDDEDDESPFAERLDEDAVAQVVAILRDNGRIGTYLGDEYNGDRKVLP